MLAQMLYGIMFVVVELVTIASPNNACSGLGGGPCKKVDCKRKHFSVSSAGSPTKPLTRAVGRFLKSGSTTIRSKSNMEANNTASVEEDIMVKRQWAALIAAFVFLAIASLISKLAFGTIKYGLLGPCIPMLYLGISSIKNRFSVLRARGQKEKYSRGSYAIYMGVLILISVAIDIVVVFTPSLSERFLPF